jgi:hypothetical protein
LLWAGGGGAVHVIFLLEGVVEASAHHAGDEQWLWDQSPRVLLSTMMASAGVSSLLKRHRWGHLPCLLLPPSCLELLLAA